MAFVCSFSAPHFALPTPSAAEFQGFGRMRATTLYVSNLGQCVNLTLCSPRPLRYEGKNLLEGISRWLVSGQDFDHRKEVSRVDKPDLSRVTEVQAIVFR